MNFITPEIWATISSYVGFESTTSSFSLTCKKFRQNYISYYLNTKSNVESGHLIESSGRPFSFILDAARYAVYEAYLVQISSGAKKILHDDINNMNNLRKGFMQDLIIMNNGVYTYWDQLGSLKVSIIEYLRELASVNKLTDWESMIESYVQYWKDCRIFGIFYLVVGRDDGAILISENLQKVYLVQGIAQSITTACRKLNGSFIGIKIQTTLLPWQDNIVYDGLMMVISDKITIQNKQKIKQIYLKAVENKTIIMKIKLKVLSTTSRTQPVSATSSIDNNNFIKDLKQQLFLELDAISKAKTGKVHSNSVSIEIAGAWVFRRHGYTAYENPHNLLTIMCASIPIVVGFTCQDLVPKIPEYIRLLVQGIRNNNNKKPVMLLIDEITQISLLETTLAEYEIAVRYYPPPSAEEQAHSRLTNPYLSQEERTRTDEWIRTHCYVCEDISSKDGQELHRCSRCKAIYYCCKEHQKIDWKRHKSECF